MSQLISSKWVALGASALSGYLLVNGLLRLYRQSGSPRILKLIVYPIKSLAGKTIYCSWCDNNFLLKASRWTTCKLPTQGCSMASFMIDHTSYWTNKTTWSPNEPNQSCHSSRPRFMGMNFGWMHQIWIRSKSRINWTHPATKWSIFRCGAKTSKV